VLPGQLGIAVFSPPLDRHGNSVRGVEVCRQISDDLNLNLLHVARSSRSALRRTFSIAEVPSRRRRPEAQVASLARVGGRANVQVLHGDLVFAAMESVVRAIVERADEIDLEIVDLAEVTEIDIGAGRLLGGLGAAMAADGQELAVVAPPHANLLAGVPLDHLRVFADLDAATEWCEERLLDRYGPPPAPAARIELAEHRLTQGFDAEMLATLAAALEPREFEAGETIFAAGGPADAAFLLLAGEVTIEVDIEGRRRLATLTPGYSFGEFALADASFRPVTVAAETAGEAMVLSVAAFERLGATDPALQAALLRNLLAGFYEIIGRLTLEVRSLLTGR
jgi:glutaminase